MSSIQIDSSHLCPEILIALFHPPPPVLQALIHDFQTGHLFMFLISFGSIVCVWNYIFIIILSLTPLIQLRLRKQNKSKTRLVKSYAHININLSFISVLILDLYPASISLVALNMVGLFQAYLRICVCECFYYYTAVQHISPHMQSRSNAGVAFCLHYLFTSYSYFSHNIILSSFVKCSAQ